MIRLGWAAFPLLLALLSGCASGPRLSAPSAEALGLWQARQVALTEVVQWDMRTRVAVRGGSTPWTGTLQWTHTLAADELLISDPLGQGAAQFNSSANAATAAFADGQNFIAPDIDSLLAEQLKWPVPLSVLGHWLRGLPAPGDAAQQTVDDAGRLRWLKQRGWRVEYTQYAVPDAVASVPELPTRLRLTRRGYEVRLVIDQWGLP